MSNLRIVEYKEGENPEIQDVYNSIPFTQFNVVFLKGFSKGINWQFSETAERGKINGVKNIETNTQLNGRFLSVFMDIISEKCKKGEKFVFICDGDDIGDNYTNIITTMMVDGIIAPNSFYIMYRSHTEKNAFKFSWGSFLKDKKGVNLNLICAPEVRDDKYEATGIYSYKKTAECIEKSSVIPKYYFYNFGGGPILDKEFSEQLPFTAIMTFYNVTRIKDGKTERNSIFNPENLSDTPQPRFVSPIQIVVNKGEVPLTIMNKNKPILDSTAKVAEPAKVAQPAKVAEPAKVAQPAKVAEPVKRVGGTVTVFDLTSDERFKFTISLNGKTTTFRDVFTKLEKNSAKVLKALGRRLEIKGYNTMKKEELVKVCKPLISFQKTDKTKPEKVVSIRKSREKNRIPRNSPKGRRLAKKPMCNQSGESVPCSKSMLIASAKRKRAYRLRKSAGSRKLSKRSRKASKRSPKRSRKASKKSRKKSRKVSKRSPKKSLRKSNRVFYKSK